MPTICKELFKNTDFYITSIIPIDANFNDHHILVSNKLLSPNKTINLVTDSLASYDDVINGQKIIFFDFIYPLSNFFGNSWTNRHMPLKMVKIDYTCTIEEIWSKKGMNYVQYYNKK